MYTLPRTLQLLARLRRHPALPPDAVRAFQFDCARAVVRHAHQQVAFYRAWYASHGYDPESLRSPEDWARIPAVDKRDLQSAPAKDLLTDGVRDARMINYLTGGTTGEPLTSKRSWCEDRILGALRRRAMCAFGFRARERASRIGFSTFPTSALLHAPLRLVRAAGFYRCQFLDCRRTPEELIRRLRSHRPRTLRGYAGAIAETARHMTDEARRDIPLRVVMTTAETLTADMRQSIEKGFGAPVFDLYASSEFNVLASQCPSTGLYHVCDDGVRLEVLREDGRPARDGEEGDVVGTALHSYAMPFIRYRLGDRVVQGPAACPCGAPFSTLRSIQGRIFEYFILAGGRRVHPFMLAELFLHELILGIYQYQLIQEREDRIVLRIVPRPEGVSPERLREVTQKLRKFLGGAMDVDIQPVADIPPGPSGKKRLFVNLLQQ